jgi:GNAT superfamily N-acetyltransferase
MGAIEGAGRWQIAALEPADAPALCALSEEAGWNQVASDWRLMLALGRGFGVGDEQGGWLGSALTLPLGAALCWISMVLVTRRARGQGLGTELLLRCLAAAEALPAQAGLDATEFGRPIYLPLGFVDLFTLARWHWSHPARRPVAAPAGSLVRAAAAADLARIVAYDTARSGLCRPAILATLLSRSAPFAQVAVGSDGALAGFVLGRDGHRSWHLGPVVADDEGTALALLSAAAAALNAPLIVDIPDRHRRLKDWLKDGGATAPRRYTRMLRGANGKLADSAHLFALAGPELG